MTLDEAIEHCESKAKEETECGKESCGLEHLQLAKWLTELKDRRNRICGNCLHEFDHDCGYCASNDSEEDRWEPKTEGEK